MDVTDDDIRRMRDEANRLQIQPVVGLCNRALGKDEPGPGGLTPGEARERLARLMELSRLVEEAGN